MTTDQERQDRLADLWNLQGFVVRSVRFERRRGRPVKIVGIEEARDVHWCPVCGRRAPAAFQESDSRLFRDCAVGDFETYVEVIPWRVRCCGGTRVERFRWQASGHRMTERFFQRVAALTSRLAVSVVAELCNLAWDTICRIDKSSIEQALGGSAPTLDGLRHIGIDEVAWTKGWRFFTIVTDLKSGRVVWLREGHRAEVFEEFFKELGPRRTARLRIVVSDLWRAFVSTIARYAPHALHVLDRFHIVQWVNDAVDRVRRRTIGKANRFKGRKWALLRARETLAHGEKLRLAELVARNRQLYRAYLLKEQLRSLLHHPWAYLGALERNLKAWCTAAVRSRMREVVKIGRRLRPHIAKVLAGFRAGVRLGLVEATNGKVVALRRQACGYRDPDYYKLKIFQRCNLGKNYVPAVAL